MISELPHAPRIVEAGPGVGLTVPRLLSWGVTGGSYRGIEIDPGLAVHTRKTLPAILQRTGHEVTRRSRGFRVDGLSVTFDVDDAVGTLGGPDGEGRDAPMPTAKAETRATPTC